MRSKTHTYFSKKFAELDEKRNKELALVAPSIYWEKRKEIENRLFGPLLDEYETSTS